jgi:hypothetical protein
MEDHGLIARDVALLTKARGIGSNKSFILYFLVTAIMVAVCLVAVFAGGVGGIVLLISLGAIGALAKFTPYGENLIIAVTMIIGIAIACITVYGAVTAVFA